VLSHHLLAQRLYGVLISGHRLNLEKNFIGLLFTPPPLPVAPSIQQFVCFFMLGNVAPEQFCEDFQGKCLKIHNSFSQSNKASALDHIAPKLLTVYSIELRIA
jgi:hypothetical protein